MAIDATPPSATPGRDARVTRKLRVKIGLATAAVAAVATVFAWPVLTLAGSGGDLIFEQQAMVAGVLGVLMASQLLHDNRRRAFLAGAALPLIALAILALLLTVSEARSRFVSAVEEVSVSEDMNLAALGIDDPPVQFVWYIVVENAIYMVYVVLVVGWILVPAGLLGTALIRRRWLEAGE